MSLKIRIISLIMILFAVSCSKKQTFDEPKFNEFMKITSETIETFDGKDSMKILVEYSYPSDSSIFWTSAVYKNTAGQVVREVKRELDKAGFPRIEMMTQGGKLVQTIVLQYNAKAMLPESKIAYNGDTIEANLSMKEITVFDTAGFMASKEIINYAPEADFRNEEGTREIAHYIYRFLPPPPARPKGPNAYFSWIESGKTFFHPSIAKDVKGKFKPGQLLTSINAKFNEQGLPTQYIANNNMINNKHNEYFSTDLNGLGSLQSITGWNDEAKSKQSAGNTEFAIEYDGNGWVAEVVQSLFSEKEQMFEIEIRREKYDWIEVPFQNKLGLYNEASVRKESTNPETKKTTVSETKIEKFADGEKVVVEREGTTSGQDDNKKDELTVKRRISSKYTVIRK